MKRKLDLLVDDRHASSEVCSNKSTVRLHQKSTLPTPSPSLSSSDSLLQPHKEASDIWLDFQSPSPPSLVFPERCEEGFGKEDNHDRPDFRRSPPPASTVVLNEYDQDFGKENDHSWPDFQSLPSPPTVVLLDDYDQDFGESVCRQYRLHEFVQRLREQMYGKSIASEYRRFHTPPDVRAAYNRAQELALAEWENYDSEEEGERVGANKQHEIT